MFPEPVGFLYIYCRMDYMACRIYRRTLLSDYYPAPEDVQIEDQARVGEGKQPEDGPD